MEDRTEPALYLEMTNSSAPEYAARRAQAAVPGYTMTTVYENATGGDPLYCMYVNSFRRLGATS